MKQLQMIQKKLSLFLLIGILILCLGFILINCGKGPQNKIVDPDSDQSAIDFSDTSFDASAMYLLSNELLNRQGTEVTLEAWIKRKKATLTGPVISRHQQEGVMLWVSSNEPKFAIRRVVGPTSTNFVVESGFSLSPNTWYHLAGVLANAVHSHPSSTSCTSAAMAETPHMDIYVNGQFKNCASTGSRSMADLSICPPDPVSGAPSYGTGSCAGDTLGVGVFVGPSTADVGTDGVFDGVIDEARYWTIDRTQAQLKACMNQELVSHNSGDCGINNSSLGAYMRFNEGKGAATSDWTGLGYGYKESPGTVPWDGGWTSGAPIVKD